MTTRAPIGIVLLLAVGLAACDSDPSVLSTAPTPPPSSGAPPPVQGVPAETWNLTGTYAGHTGPAACIPPFDTTVVQAPITGTIRIQRAGESLDVITEHDHYVGTVVAQAYSATDSDTGTWQCGAARYSFRAEGHVSGNFSADGRSLMGEEGVVFRLESGGTITRRWVWAATRQ
jgi:hypothetical protein